MIDFIKKHKKEILISLVTGIIIFYFQPLLTYLGDTIIGWVLTISKTFSNGYYKSVAENDPNLFSDDVNLLQIYCMIYLGLYWIGSLQTKRERFKRKIENMLSSINNLKERLNNIDSKESFKSKDDLSKGLNASEARVLGLRESFEKGKRAVTIAYVGVIVIFLLLAAKYTMAVSVSGLNLKFRNETMKVAPFVDDIEIKKLQSRWVQMESKDDYEGIIKDLTNLRKKGN